MSLDRNKPYTAKELATVVPPELTRVVATLPAPVQQRIAAWGVEKEATLELIGYRVDGGLEFSFRPRKSTSFFRVTKEELA